MNRLPALILFLTMAAYSYAGPVSRSAARTKAESFLKERGITLQDDVKLAKSAPLKGSQSDDAVAYYVFNASEANGFVIVSGDDRTEAILGYSDSGTFDADDLPENLSAWLEEYAEQIAFLSTVDSSQYTASKSVDASYTAISPMLKSKWTQRSPYNDLCPEYNGTNCLVGCTALALAQIMYYHRWPEDSTTVIPGYTAESIGIELEDLPAVKFDWDSMVTPYSDEDAAAALLMRYVSQGIETIYGVSGSGAYSPNGIRAMIKYFGYDANASYERRKVYTYSDWHALIYGELSEGRPVFYGGNSERSGHGFVCDGYDGAGLYHINWGWGGLYDGYYKLDALNPGYREAYSIDQIVCRGLQPSTGADPDPYYLTMDSCVVSSNTIESYIYNVTTYDGYFTSGWGILSDEGEITTVIEEHDPKYMVLYDCDTLTIDVSTIGLTEGSYKIVPISHSDISDEWISANPSFAYFEVVVDSDGGISSIVIHPVVGLEATSFEFTCNKVAGDKQEVMVEVTNTAEEFYKKLYMFASTDSDKGKYQYAIAVAIDTGGSFVVPMYFTPSEAGTYNIWITTDVSGEEVIGETTVEIVACPTSDSNLELVEGSLTVDGTVLKVSVEVKNNNTESYLRPFSFYFYRGTIDEEEISAFNLLKMYQSIAPGETEEVSCSLDCLEDDFKYIVSVYYFTNSESIASNLLYEGTFTMDSAGIIHTVSDLSDDAPYYTLSGMRVNTPLKKGVYIHKGKKVIIK